MNNIAMLRTAIVLKPFEPAPAAMLIDALIEEEGCPEAEARAAVEDFVRAAVLSAEYGYALRLVQENEYIGRALALEMQILHGGTGPNITEVQIDFGEAAPTFYGRAGWDTGDWQHEQVVAVGASFLLAHYRRNRQRIIRFAQRLERSHC